jgi:hypothetical protein
VRGYDAAAFYESAFAELKTEELGGTMSTDEERTQRESNLVAAISKNLPEFAKACADAEVVLLHQDAFAADYQDDEYMLLGMAIKYAGLRRKEVRVIVGSRGA